MSIYIRAMAYSIVTGEEFYLCGFGGGTYTIIFLRNIDIQLNR
ncbi:hypothetical protein HMPREF0078_0628 [Anaerococcus vaginalis ATCC 51170]|uniref:Uncharacterized protein n=1 Tax=Anaerococcus vaginalis ATCC 51170 TaxID=655811 RepID=C7HTM7_9FIRM|nr:hypothetical protein HMPREF0078_0628 [Anaerococcus vaginalis ATCC 51170]